MKNRKLQIENYCKKCGSYFTYFKRSTNEVVCRKCGHTEIIKEKTQ